MLPIIYYRAVLSPTEAIEPVIGLLVQAPSSAEMHVIWQHVQERANHECCFDCSFHHRRRVRSCGNGPVIAGTPSFPLPLPAILLQPSQSGDHITSRVAPRYCIVVP
jgi:hypothetical protein